MKTLKLTIAFLIISMICCLASCDYDPYKGKRPVDQPGTTWVCEEYQMKYTVGSYESSEFVTENRTIHFQFMFSLYSNWVSCYEYDKEGNKVGNPFDGACEFSKDNFIIEVYQNENSEVYFDKFPVTLIFKKVE